jgi:SAM-dependent methyltransferase
MNLLERLKLPELAHIDDLDDVRTTLLHATILQRKGFMKRLYTDFYRQLNRLVREHAAGQSVLVELGSGGGFIKDVIAHAVTSDVLEIATVDRVFSATRMPFEDGSVDAFVMIDVLHHLGEIETVFHEFLRCLKPGGAVVMIEPANTLWGRFIYHHFHHEPFEPDAGWGFASKGPLSAANGALPWIVFHRDRERFLTEFAGLDIVHTCLHTPFAYLVSGGFTLRQLAPAGCYRLVRGVEWVLSPLNRWIGMFETIVLRKT